MFKIGTTKEIIKKAYVRTFLRDKINAFVKIIMNHVPFEDICTAVLTFQPSLRYKAFSPLIREVFLDKVAELKMCTEAKEIVLEECHEMGKSNSTVKTQGLLWRHIKCGLCNRSIQKSQRVEIDFQSLLVFECTRSAFNHAFHERCLTNFLKEELRKDKKAQIKDDSVRLSFRCPICYKQCQDISFQGVQRTNRLKTLAMGR